MSYVRLDLVPSGAGPVARVRLCWQEWIMDHVALRSSVPDGPCVPLAVVGAACRLPGGITGLEGLWAALVQGRDLISPVPPADRFDAARFCDPDPERPGKACTMAGGYLGDIAGFDPGYFGISPREAEYMDPQQRLLLEMAAEAFDDAALDPAALAGSDTAVFIGVSDMSYGGLLMNRLRDVTAYSMSGSALSVVANRLSYVFDLRGPSLAVDTACSSSLVAVHQACETLRAGHSRVALAGGVNLLVSPYGFVGFSRALMLSPRGRCAAFSAGADGYVRAEGGGVVVLKRLADALADGDRVHAVIAGSGSNCDGSTSAMTVPSAGMQERLLREVYERAGTGPDQVVYFEAHGTGTPVGDPVECRAVGRALGVRRTGGPLPIGSVKTNLGHLEPASGMAGLFKGMLVLRHGRIPASLHGEPVNPEIDFAALNLCPVGAVRPVADGDGGVVGVNSFGFGGANAHVVLGAAPARRQVPPRPPRPLPLVVSARTRQALSEAVRAAADHMGETAAGDFYDVCWTASQRRARHPFRAAVLAHGPQDAARQLAVLAGNEEALAAACAHAGRPVPGGVVFVLSGNGTQWPGMGTALVAGEPAFRAAVEEADAHLMPLLGWSVAELLAGGGAEGVVRMADTGIAQPALFAFQLGLVALLAECGVRPAAVVGHSFGELAAACVSGALSLPDAARAVVVRSMAQAVTAGTGGMAAVGLGEEEAREAIVSFEGLEIAAVNSGRDVTVSGPAGALRALGRELSGRQVPFRELPVEHPFHSAAMEVLEEPLRTGLAGLNPSTPQVPMYSTVTGAAVTAGQLDAAYWWHHARRPVRFAEAMRRAVDAGLGAVCEIAPQQSLAGVLHRIAADTPGGAFPVISPVSRHACTGPAVRQAAAQLLAASDRSATSGFFPVPGAVADLPPYPWQRERYWVAAGSSERLVHPLLGERAPVLEPTWQSVVERTRTPWLADHRLSGTAVMPSTAYVELALAAGRETLGSPVEVTDLDIPRALPLSWDAQMDVHLQTSLSDEDGIVRIASRTSETGGWRLHARGRVRHLAAARPQPIEVASVRQRTTRRISGEKHYRIMAAGGLYYGPAFQVLRELHVGRAEVLATYHCDLPDDGCGGYVLHPVLLDGAVHAGGPLVEYAECGYLPSAYERIRHWAKPAVSGLVHVRQRSYTRRELVLDITVTDENGTVAVEMTGCRLRRLSLPAPKRGEGYISVLRAAPLPGQPVPAWAPPSPPEVAATAGPGLERLRRTAGAERYAQVYASQQALVASSTARAFAELLPQQDTFTFEDLLAAGVLPRYEKLVRLLADVAVREGLLTVEGQGWQRLCSGRRPSLTNLAGITDYLPSCLLNLRFAVNLPDLLCGRRDGRELLFRDSGPETAQLLYDIDPATGFHNRMAAELLAALIRAWPEDRPLRILEVGAGTGGLTSHLLPLLDDRVHYVFSDISAVFFTAAEARFEPYEARLDYRIYDLDTDPHKQGLTDASFDLVIAGFSLHTAADLRACLRRLARLTAPGGHLLALEAHEPRTLALTFGTLKEFWAAQDRALRPDSILLPRRTWRDVLADSGYENIIHLGAQTEPLHEHYSVLLAHTPAQAPAGAKQAPATVHTPPAKNSWLLVTEDTTEDGLGALTADELVRHGCRSADLVPCPGSAQGWQDLLSRMPGRAVLLMLSSTPDQAAEGDVAACTDLAVRRAANLRSLAQAELAQPSTPARHLVLLTHPTGALPAPERPAFPGQAAAWGVSRTLANESAMRVRRISLDRSLDPAEDAARLSCELLASPPEGELEEDEVALTRGGRFVHRFERAASAAEPVQPGGTTCYRLEVTGQGLGFGLRWIETTPPVPGPQEVVIAVRAAALNYRDIMVATGLLPPVAEDGIPSDTLLGLEGAGVVTAVGDRVQHLTVGDRVFGLFVGAFASHARTLASRVRHLPSGMTFHEAVTLPAAYVTVHHSLHHLARLQSGESLLIHGATGGVGMAAAVVARLTGARVVATAGNPAKRDVAAALGADLVLDSRGRTFADEVREHTGGRGVDVVLNSLSGEAADRSRELLASGGRFIELGKRDAYNNQRLLQKALADNTTLCTIDITGLLWRHPRRTAQILDETMERVLAGDYTPLPHQIYPAHRIIEAFRLMQHSKHMGKIVISFNESVPVHRTPRTPRPDPDGTYLVTGGLSGFGATTARHLADNGARHLALVSRRGEQAPEAAQLLEELRAQGVNARAYAVDISDEEAVRALVHDITRNSQPIRGIVHAAMHLDDDRLTNLTDERIRAVIAPKWAGALLLDSLCPQAHFILYSSASAAVGFPLQAAYAAGNLTMEALVRARHTAGRPALAMAWGTIGHVGYVARNNLTTTMTAMGAAPVNPQDALAAMTGFLARGTAQATFANPDWGRLTAIAPSLLSPRFAALLPATGEGIGRQFENLPERLTTSTHAEAAHIIEGLLISVVADILHMPPQDIDPYRPLVQYGMDSLMSMELLTKLRKHFDQDIPVMEFLHSDGSIHGTAETVLPHLLRRAQTTTPRPASPTPHTDQTTREA
ncbi:SDR family NAD(P)-dependent oxidoreductase [Streptomyces sp. NPDC026206]|uniref:SDR family NAD(P)-dependent oxidoreductase n=1 Tax=Streptomyces sp. NPDC026206 TaxID=3157089 RepID=UPI003404066A